MNAAWRMIPRYHPQVGPAQVLLARTARGGTLSLPGCAPRSPREGEDLYGFNSATAGLRVALEALALPPGSGVGVPIYACEAVFGAVASAGLRCVFLDAETETFGIDPESLRRSRRSLSAVVMIHTFGYGGRVDAVRQLAGDVPVLEDCAHALGSRQGGRPLGLDGVASVFSFNFHKPVSAGGGGMLLINDPQLIPAVRLKVEALGAKSGAAGLRARLRRAVKAGLYRPPWYGLAMAAGLERRRAGGVLGEATVEPISPLDRALIAEGLRGWDRRLAEQKDWARRLGELCGDFPPVRAFLAAGDDWNGYLFPILLDGPASREAGLAFFRRRGVDAFVLWEHCLRNAARYGYQAGSCPRLEEALPRLMLLPCYAEMTASRRWRIAEALSAWRAERPG